MFLGLLPLIALVGGMTLGALRAVSRRAAATRPPRPARTAADRSRLPLAILVSLGVGLVTVGLTVPELGVAVALSLLGAILGLFALRRLTPPGTLAARPVLPAAVLLRGLLTFMFFGFDAFVALVLVDWRGRSLTESGIALTATTVLWTAGSWVQARNTDALADLPLRPGRVRRGPARAGRVHGRAAPGRHRGWSPSRPSRWPGFGMGLAYSPLALIVLREASPETQGSASSALSLTDSLGTALGTGRRRGDRGRQRADQRRAGAGSRGRVRGRRSRSGSAACC